MIRTLTILARLRLTIGWNSFVHSWRKVPLIRRLNLGGLIGNDDVTLAYYTLATFVSLMKALVLAALYTGICLFLPIVIYMEDRHFTEWTALGGLIEEPTASGIFIGMFVLLAIMGSSFRLPLLRGNSDTYYAVFLMRMDAREYALCDLMLSFLKTFIGQVPFLLLFGALAEVPLWLCCLLPFVTLAVKQIGNGRRLLYLSYQKKNTAYGKKSSPISVVHYAVNTAAIIGGFLLIVLQFVNGYSAASKLYLPLIVILLAAGIACSIPIFLYRDYRGLYDSLRLKGDFLEKTPADLTRSSTQEALELDHTDTAAEAGGSEAQRFGYDEFHKVFMQRHKKLMTRSANFMTYVILVIFLIITALRIVTIFINDKDAVEMFGAAASGSMPYMTLLLYWLNRGQNMTNAMFINCDHAMLAYSFYREPSTILAMFRRRLRSLVLVNLRPAAAIALCVTACGFYGADKLTFIPLLYGLTVLLLSVFFSLHTLVMYYLLQPFDINSQSTGKMYRIVSVITYVACYSIDDIVKDPIVYCIGTTGFTLVYIVLGLLLVQRFAPKTFRIH